MSELLTAFGISKNDQAFELIEQTMPSPSGHDLLVKIDAIAINPVDTKVKASLTEIQDPQRILGWDAAGTVIATGEQCTLFKTGDKVFYAGDINRAGCYASHQLVDERIVGKAPVNLSAEQSAAMPLTSITAWEALFSRLKIETNADNKTLLIIGGAGGVGSIATQLAKAMTKMTVIATASRPESQQWCQKMGADTVINHHGDLVEQYKKLNLPLPDYILCCADTDPHFDAMAELIAAEGMICGIVDTKKPQQLAKLKAKSAGFVWEFMFTRAMGSADAKIKQHQLLNRVAKLIDQGQIHSTVTANLGVLSVSTLRQAHEQILSGSTIGKIVLTGYN